MVRLTGVTHLVGAVRVGWARTHVSKQATEGELIPLMSSSCVAVEALELTSFFAVDSSHDQIGRPRPFKLLSRLQHRLMAVQVCDRIQDVQNHVLPGEGFMNWRDLCAELYRERFDHPLLLELSTTCSAVKDPREYLTASTPTCTSACALVTQLMHECRHHASRGKEPRRVASDVEQRGRYCRLAASLRANSQDGAASPEDSLERRPGRAGAEQGGYRA